ncbi:MAG: hypothetical protein ABJA82_02635 [Myxococcales bacterium]
MTKIIFIALMLGGLELSASCGSGDPGQSTGPACTDPALPVPCPAHGGAPAACQPPGTVCANIGAGCVASNTEVAPLDGVIATFMSPGDGTDIPGQVFASRTTPAPGIAVDGALHVTVSASATTEQQVLLVVDHFKNCIDASGFAGVQFSIRGSLSGCTLGYFTQDSAHLFDTGDPVRDSHGSGPSGVHPPFNAFSPGQITTAPQTLMVPFTVLTKGVPETPIEPSKITGLGWVFFVPPLSGSGAPSCVADLSIDDVRFY